MQINVIIFGKLKEITGTGTLQLDDVSDTNEMVKEMNRKYPDLTNMKYLIAVEKEIIQDNTKLEENDTVALLPPYSGG